MTAKNMTAAQVVEALEKYDEEMLAVIVFLEPTQSRTHSLVEFNRIQLSERDQTLQFANDVDKPVFSRSMEMKVGKLLIRIKKILYTAKKPFEAPEYLVCKREYDSQSHWEDPEKTMYLKNIEPTGEFQSNSFTGQEFENAVFLEFRS